MARYSTSPTGFGLIKAFEGFRAEAAPLANGSWVIGYGHTVSARKGTLINKADAADLLKWDVKRLEAPLCDLIYAPLSQNQFDALISLVFNIGLENFKYSKALRRLNEGCPVDAASGFDTWRRAQLAEQVIVVDALVRRRTAEKALFLSTPGANVIAPTPQLPPLCDLQMAHQHETETPHKVKVDLQGNGDATIEPERTEYTSELPADSGDDNQRSQEEDEPTGLVSLDEAFETKLLPPTESPSEDEDKTDNELKTISSPVTEIAEKIAGRLETVATETKEVDDNDGLQLLPGDEIPDTGKPEKPADEDDAPPIVDENGVLLEAYEPDLPSAHAYDVYNENAAPIIYDEPIYDGSDVEPQTLLSDAKIIQESSEFQPAYDRGRGIFMLMGVIGIILTLGGLWQIQSVTSMTTNLDLLKGPGQAFIGVLLWVVGAYYLLRRLNR